MESSGKGFSNERYLREYGIDETMVTPLELAGLDPPPYEGHSIRGASFLPETPSPAPITETGVVMGDFLDERIDDLYTRIQKLENIVDKCCDDDEFEDVQEALQLIRSGKTPEVTAKPAKKFDYKTKGWIIIDVRLAGLFDISHASSSDIKRKKYLKELMKKNKLPNTRHIDILKITGTQYTLEIIESMKKISKYGFWKAYRSGGVTGGIIETNNDLERIIRTKLANPQTSHNWFNVNQTIPGRGCKIYLAPGASLKLIKEKMEQGYEIDFEDENDKREVEAMQGGGYRRRNTRRKSRKRNTRRNSRKRNTSRKSRKRNTRRKSRKRNTRRKSRKRNSRMRSKKK